VNTLFCSNDGCPGQGQYVANDENEAHDWPEAVFPTARPAILHTGNPAWEAEMSLARKYYLTDADEARMLAKYLAMPYEDVHRQRRQKAETWREIKKKHPGLRPDESQGNHQYEFDMQVLEGEIRIIGLALPAIGPIRAGLERIHAKWPDLPLLNSLGEVYDLCATELRRISQPLTEPLLKEGIPYLVFSLAVERDWIPYPLRLPETGPARDFLEGWGRRFPYKTKRQGMPSLESRPSRSEDFGSYMVPKGFGAWFRGHLESRSAHWRAEASRQQARNDLSEFVGESPRDHRFRRRRQTERSSAYRLRDVCEDTPQSGR
jgi:hypothetical protein